MARIRSIKPEFFTSLSIAELTIPARLAFVGLWTHVDDDGRAVDEPRLVKAALFPLDDEVTVEEVDAMLDEMAKRGRVIRYEVDGRRFLQVVGWGHQKIDRKRDSAIPPPPVGDGSPQPPNEPSEESTSDQRGVSEDSSPDLDRIGSDLDRIETTPSPPATDVETVFDAWREATGHHRAVLDPKRRRLITARLKEFPPDDLVDAVRGWKHSAHHRGENDRRTVYDDIELLLRDAAHVERFRDLERGGRRPSVVRSKGGASVQRALERREVAS